MEWELLNYQDGFFVSRRLFNYSKWCTIQMLLYETYLTHPLLDEMAAILQTIFPCAFYLMKILYFVWISLKFAPMSPIDNTSTLVQVMAWRRTGDKPLPEPNNICWLSLLTHICGTRGRSVNLSIASVANTCMWNTLKTLGSNFHIKILYRCKGRKNRKVDNDKLYVYIYICVHVCLCICI